MIDRELNNIEENHAELTRCNSILEGNWADSSAEQFKNTYLGPIEAAGTSYIADIIPQAQELRRNIEELDNLQIQFDTLKKELRDLCQHPSWEGCGIGVVEGYDLNNTALHGQEFFVITKEEMPYLNDDDMMEHLAYLRVTNLDEMANARYYSLTI